MKLFSQYQLSDIHLRRQLINSLINSESEISDINGEIETKLSKILY